MQLDKAKAIAEKLKYVVYLSILFAILGALLYQSNLDNQCMKYHADGAVWTISGVKCYRVKTATIREYFDLEELRENHEGPPANRIISPPPTQPNL